MEMSLRQIAKELGVSHSLLVLWRQGKRNLSPELEERYYQLVTSGYKNGYNQNANFDENSRFPNINPGAEGGTRTHTPVKVADFKSAASSVPPPRLMQSWYPPPVQV
jgi:transcriptional regulator with XRE-family HTH domain